MKKRLILLIALVMSISVNVGAASIKGFITKMDTDKEQFEVSGKRYRLSKDVIITVGGDVRTQFNINNLADDMLVEINKVKKKSKVREIQKITILPH